MKRLIKLILIFMFAGFIATKSFASEDSRVIIDNYFEKTSLDVGPNLPDPNKLKQIISAGVNLNYEGRPGSPSALYRLHNVATEAWDIPKTTVDNRMKELFVILLEGGLNITDNCNENMYSVIKEGMTNYIDALMKKGCDLVKLKINIGSGNSPQLIAPIELAEKYGHDDLVEIFIKYGDKRLSIKDRAQLRLIGGVIKLNKLQILDAIANGARINLPDVHGDYALIELAESNDLPTEKGLNTLHLLIKFGAKPDKSYGGKYALDVVVEQMAFHCKILKCGGYDVQVVNALLDGGALISAKSDFLKRTPLHTAVEKNYFDVARVLVERGAKVMILDGTGKTPLDLAKSGDMIKLLKEHGAVERGY